MKIVIWLPPLIISNLAFVIIVASNIVFLDKSERSTHQTHLSSQPIIALAFTNLYAYNRHMVMIIQPDYLRPILSLLTTMHDTVSVVHQTHQLTCHTQRPSSTIQPSAVTQLTATRNPNPPDPQRIEYVVSNS